METIERLCAAEEIRALKARYFRSVDLKDWSALEAVFAADIVFDRTQGNSVFDPVTGTWNPPLSAEPLLVHGRDAVIAMVRRAVAGVTTVHHGHMPEIEIIGPDRAAAIWAMSDELRDRRGRLVLAGRGHYHDTYVRGDGSGWRIATSRLSRLSLMHGDGVRDGEETWI